MLYRARLAEDHRIHDAGVTQEEAIAGFLITAKSLGCSGDRGDYEVVIVQH